jgi:hypothetical protein
MSLNSYTDEVKEFIRDSKLTNIDNQQIITWLEDEFELLKAAVKASERDQMEHQIYDMLYLLFEFAAENEFDLDQQWQSGKRKKQDKYLKKQL